MNKGFDFMKHWGLKILIMIFFFQLNALFAKDFTITFQSRAHTSLSKNNADGSAAIELARMQITPAQTGHASVRAFFLFCLPRVQMIASLDDLVSCDCIHSAVMGVRVQACMPGVW